MGAPWHAAQGARRPALSKRIPVRRHLPGAAREQPWRCCLPTLRPCSFTRRDQRGARRACRAATRPARKAHDRQAEGAEKYRRCCCRREPRNSTRLRTSGNICAPTAFPTASSTATTLLSTPPARLGRSSSPNPKQSHQSECESWLTFVELHDPWYKVGNGTGEWKCREGSSARFSSIPYINLIRQ